MREYPLYRKTFQFLVRNDSRYAAAGIKRRHVCVDGALPARSLRHEGGRICARTNLPRHEHRHSLSSSIDYSFLEDVVQSPENQTVHTGFRPSHCALCQSQPFRNVVDAVRHLTSDDHLSRVGGICLCGSNCRKSRGVMKSILECPVHRIELIKLGYDVFALDSAVADKSAFDQPAVDAALEIAKQQIPPDFDWLQERAHWFVLWDGRCIGNAKELPLSRAANFKQTIRRVKMSVHPPIFRRPGIPRYYHPRPKLYKKPMWPYSPGSVSLALATIFKAGASMVDVHLVAGTSFLMALSGQAYGMEFEYLAQRFGHTILVQRIPRNDFPSIANDGNCLESMCSQKRSLWRSNYMVRIIQTGKFKILTASEVDTYSLVTYKSIELKLSKAMTYPRPKHLLHIAFQGSTDLAFFCSSNVEEHCVDRMKMYPIGQLQKQMEETWVFAGQRFQYVLGELLLNPMVQDAIEKPVRVAFGEDQMPYVTPCPGDYYLVTPPGSWRLLRGKERKL